MLLEPGHFRREADAGFRALVLSHTLLSYLSALGAHRAALPAELLRGGPLERAAEHLTASLDELARALVLQQPPGAPALDEEALARTLEQLPDDSDERQRLLHTELALLCRQLAPLRATAARLLQARADDAAEPHRLP
jgi:uncharacterized membrane protein YccC